MIKRLSLIAVAVLAMTSCKNDVEKESEMNTESTELTENSMDDKMNNEAPDLKITPISHATFVMEWNGNVIYVDPTGGATAFDGFPAADYVLVTDIHGDHMDQATLDAVVTDKSMLILPKAVKEKLTGFDTAKVMANGQTSTLGDISISAIPMYNITEGRLDKHVKGRGNGYVLEIDGYRVYISGDTEDIAEMRALKDIDLAFLCMNLPYTMDIDQAADAVLEFKPKKVMPYHYRGTDGFQDVEAFKSKVAAGDKNIEVELREWYPKN
jgi:L-ascorbate metabolism protein UlaG (beta-lactamase superfamily)